MGADFCLRSSHSWRSSAYDSDSVHKKLRNSHFTASQRSDVHCPVPVRATPAVGVAASRTPTAFQSVPARSSVSSEVRMFDGMR